MFVQQTTKYERNNFLYSFFFQFCFREYKFLFIMKTSSSRWRKARKLIFGIVWFIKTFGVFAKLFFNYAGRILHWGHYVELWFMDIVANNSLDKFLSINEGTRQRQRLNKHCERIDSSPLLCNYLNAYTNSLVNIEMYLYETSLQSLNNVKSDGFVVNITLMFTTFSLFSQQQYLLNHQLRELHSL